MPGSPEIRLGLDHLWVAGRGGEHVVYKDHSLMYKVNAFMARKFLMGEITSDEVEAMAARRQKRHSKMRNLIGQEHVAAEETAIIDSFLPEETCRALAPEATLSFDSRRHIRTPLIVVMQDYFVEVEEGTNRNAQVLSLGNGRYAEECISPRDDAGLKRYSALTDHLVFGKALPQDHFDTDWPGIHLSRRAISRNQRAFQDLHIEASHYTNVTGEALDLVGPYNGFIDGSFKLIDALWPVDCKLVEEAAEHLLLLNGATMPELTRVQKLSILNAVHYVRTLNYMGFISTEWTFSPFPKKSEYFLDMFAKMGRIEWRDDISERVYQVNRDVLSEPGRPSLIY